MRPRLLLADDSPYVRLSLGRGLAAQGFDVVGHARDGEETVEQNLLLEPDLVLLDLQMPRMDGVEATRRIRQTRPVPILVFATMDARGAEMAVRALAEGAYDVVAKGGGHEAMVDLAAHVWAIVGSRVGESWPRRPPARGRPRVGVVASSTGGPPCVERLLAALPAGYPVPLAVAQHMPAGFTRSFAERLDALCALRVFEAVDGATVGPGQVAVLPGGHVSTLEATSRRDAFRVNVGSGETLPGAKPSASALFFSALGAAEGDVLGVVMTGMGADGSDAVRALVNAGATVIAQDPSEAAISSMPNAALLAGAQRRLRVDQMPRALLELARPEEAA